MKKSTIQFLYGVALLICICGFVARFDSDPIRAEEVETAVTGAQISDTAPAVATASAISDTAPAAATASAISDSVPTVSTASAVRLNKSDLSLYTGKTATLKLKKADNAQPIVWKTSSKRIATVSGGVITAKKAGTVTVSAVYMGKTYECSVTVTVPYLTFKSKDCNIGDTFKLGLKGDNVVSYSSSDGTVVKVTKKGTVTALRAGKATITVTGESGKKYKAKIYVWDTNHDLSIVSLRQNFYSVPAATTIKVKNSSFTVEPGTLVNFDSRLKYSGTPEGLIKLTDSKLTKHLTYSNKDHMLQESIIEPLSEMIDACYAAGYHYLNISDIGTYRSYSQQKSWWDARVNQDSSYGYDPYSNPVRTQEPIGSEHRTGYAIDLQTTDSGYKWLTKNCYKYGFILRYPEDKECYTGIIYEYWHFTYVGKAIAETCYKEKLCLEEYYDKYVFGAPEF